MRTRLRRCALAAALALQAAPALADPISIFIAAEAVFGATAAGVLATLASYAGVALAVASVASSIYGGMDARRRARHAQEDARRAYNASLADRTVTALGAEPALRAVYGQCRTGGDLVAIFTSDKQGTRTDGTSYTKPDALKHLVVVLAAHEVEDIVEMYIDGVAVGALDASGWATTGDAARAQTYTREVVIAHGASQAFPAAVTVLNALDANGYLVRSAQDYGEEWFGSPVTYTLTDGGKTVNCTGSVDGKFLLRYSASPGTVRWSKHLGTDTQTADAYLSATVPAQWTADDRLRGLAYVVVTLDLEDQRFQAAPPQMTWLVKGRKLYDPRTAASAWSANPALVVRDWLTARWGLEVAALDIDDASVIAAANACDATISLTVDATTTTGQPTYTCNGTVSSGDDRERTLDALCDAMAGWAVHEARWRVFAGVWTAPVLSLGDADLAGQIDVIQAGAALDDVYNGLRGSYMPDGAGVQSDYVYQNAAFVAADGRELWSDLPLPYTDNPARVRNIARIKVEAARDSQVLRVPCKLTAWPLQVGDRVSLTSAEYGLSAKTYRVTDWQFGLASPVLLTLQEDAAAIYDLADAAVSDPAPNTGLPSPWSVAAPTGVGATSGDANIIVRADGSVNVRTRVAWDAYAGPYVADGSGRIEVRWRSPLPRMVGATLIPGDAPDAWRLVTTGGDATSAWIDGCRAGDVLLIAVTAVNGAGQSSAAVVISHTVTGKSAAPAAPAGFALAIAAGQLAGSWERSPDADYTATEVRASDANWGATSPPPIWRGAAQRYAEAILSVGTTTRYARHIDSSGNQSATASASLAVTANDLARADRNLVNAGNWVIGSSGSQTGGAGTAWMANATSTGGANTIVADAGPDGSVVPLWQATSGSAAGTSHEGGISDSLIGAIDANAAYRFCAWLQPSGPMDGSLYLGPGSSEVDALPSGTLDTNPYFHVAARSGLTAGRWYLFTGYVYPAGYTRQDNNSGIWDGETGQRFANGNDYRWHAGQASANIRTYMFYTGGAGRTCRWAGIRVDRIDGSEPSVQALLAGTRASWAGVSGAGKPADGATVGATWGSNISGQPANSALLNSMQQWNDVSGVPSAAMSNILIDFSASTYDLALTPAAQSDIISDATATGGTCLRIMGGWTAVMHLDPGAGNRFAFVQGKTYKVFIRAKKVGSPNVAACLFGIYDNTAAAVKWGGGAIPAPTTSWVVYQLADFVPNWNAGNDVYTYWGSGNANGVGDTSNYVAIDWVYFQPVNADDGSTKNTVTRSYTAPSSPTNGDIWLQTDSGGTVLQQTWYRSGGAWLLDPKAIRLELSQSSASVPADSGGVVSSFANATTTAKVWVGATDDTANWTISRTDGTGMTSSLSGAVLSVSAMTVDAGYVDITAARTGYSSMTQRFSVSKAKSATAGSGAITGTFFSCDDTGAAPRTAQVRFNADGTVQTKGYAGSTWTAAGNWYTPTTSGIGSSYWLKATMISGTFSGGTVGSWASLSAGLTFYTQVLSGVSAKTANASYSLSTTSGGTAVVASGGIYCNSDTT